MALRGLLHAAGVEGLAVEIPNKYWPPGDGYDDVRSPWLRVFTKTGVIVIGWRKKAISIDWSDGMFAATGADVVAESWITHDEKWCHAWGYEQAAWCLYRLWSAGPVRPTPGGGQ